MTHETLQHDAKAKRQVKDAIYEFLYSPLEKRFNKWLQKIILDNCRIGGFPHQSFMFRSVIYNCDTEPLPRRMNKLVPDLVPEMMEYLKEQKELNEREIPYVLGYLNQVLNSSSDLHDYLRLLPQSVHGPLRTLIDTCPCRTQRLPEDVVKMLTERNQLPIELMKQRMLNNLLI